MHLTISKIKSVPATHVSAAQLADGVKEHLAVEREPGTPATVKSGSIEDTENG